MTDKRIILLDPSTLANADCMRKIQLGNRQGLQPKLGSDPLDFGQALHRGIADYRTDFFLRGPTHVNSEKSIAVATDYYDKCLCAKEPPRTRDTLALALTFYFEKVIPRDQFVPLMTPDKTKLALEIPFKIPLFSNATTDVLLSGVLDGVGHYGQRMVMFDTKHSATFDIKKHLQEQITRPQFQYYAEAMHYLGYGMGDGKYLPIVIDGVYLGNGDDIRFARSEVYQIPTFLIERSMIQARHIAQQMAELEDKDEWPHNFNACQGRYRMCEFNTLCSIPTSSQAIPRRICYKERVYDPTTFGD